MISEKQADKIINLLEEMNKKLDELEPTVVYSPLGGGATVNVITSEGVAKVLGDIQHTTEKGKSVSRMLKEILTKNE